MTTPQAPTLLAPAAGFTSRSVPDIAHQGTNLVTIGELQRHDIVSTAIPAAPTFVRSHWPTGSDRGVSVGVLDNGLFLVGREAPWGRIDVFQASGGPTYWIPLQPSFAGPAIIGRGFLDANPVVVRGTNLTVLGESFSSGRYDRIGNLGLSFTPSALAGDGPVGHAYIAGGTNGLLVADVSVPAQPRLIGTNATRGPAKGVTVHWPYVFVAEGFAGVEVFDAANPSNLVAVAHFDTRGEAESVSLEGDRVYVADGARGVTILRWASGRQPQTITPPPLLTRVTNSPPFALTATASSGLPVTVHILGGPLAAVGDFFRTTNSAFTSPRETNKVVSLRFESAGSEAYEPAYLDAAFDVVRQPSPTDRYGTWILFNHPSLSAAEMHSRADPDGDGAFNEQEFVFGGNPTVADAADGRLSPPRVEFDGTRWVVRFAITVNPAYAAGSPRAIPQVAPAADGPWTALPASQYRLEGDQLVISLPLDEAVPARLVRLRLQQL